VIDGSKYHCDAGLVGFPNAGKSTLYNALTGESPSKLMPRFGKVGRDFVLADIAGISPLPSPPNKNPGSRWMAFAESASVLIFVIGLLGRKPGFYSGPSAHVLLDRYAERDVYEYLLNVACAYHKDFAQKDRIIVLNNFTKNTEKALAILEDFNRRFPKVLLLSAASGEGVQELASYLKSLKSTRS
jgi:GTP-binding protein